MNKSYMAYYRQIGENVKYYRKKRHMTQDQLSEEVDTDRTHIANIENGRKVPSTDLIISLSLALGVSPDKLLEERKHWYID